MQHGQFAMKLEPGHADWGQVIIRAEQGLRRVELPPQREGMLRYWLGLALSETGDLYRAEQELNRALAIGEQTADLAEIQADALYRLGQVHRLFRRTDQAVAAFQEAALHHHRLGQSDREVRCRKEAAWALLLAGSTKRALPELEAAETGRSALNARGLAHELTIVRALYLSLTGDRQASDRLCLELLDHPPLRPGQRADVAWILGCNALAVGNRSAAELHAAIAHEYAVEAWWPPQLERVSELTRRLTSAADESRR